MSPRGLFATALVMVAACAGAATTNACSSDDSAPGDAGFVTADHPPLPRVKNRGGAVLAAPKVVPIFWRGFAYNADVAALAAGVGKTDYWRATTAEYGIGPLVGMPPITLTDTPGEQVRSLRPIERAAVARPMEIIAGICADL